jgi:dolichyl-phosphate beta-glucosyltransferase
MDLSIIIPAFAERQKIVRDIRAAAEFLTCRQWRGEIIVVDDGSRDDTAVVAQNVAVAPGVNLNVIRHEQNQGKGFAVRAGIRASQGEYVMFADSGLCVPYPFVEDGVNLIKNGACEIAHGSRKLNGSRIIRPQAWPRRLTARLFRWLAVYWMKIPAHLTDTQCGFKIYRGEVARELYGECRTNGFIFDIEIILRALRRGYRIREFPIVWTCDRDSRLSLTRSPWQILSELQAIKRNLRAV